MKSALSAFGVLLSVSATGGCAVGYGVGTTTHSASASSSPRSGFAEDGEIKFSSTYQEFRVIDSTGLILAAMVNAGRQHNARADAMQQAQYRTPDASGKVKVEYSWEPMPILAGLLTDLRIRLPLGTPSLEMPTGNESTRPVDFWAFEIRPEFYTFRPFKSLPMVSSLWFNVKAEDWNAPSDVDASLFELDLGFGSSTSYIVREDLTATGRVGIGLISPMVNALVGGGIVNPSAEVEVGWRPWHSDRYGLQVSGVGYLGREGALERSVVATRLGLNVAVTFGMQSPKDMRPTAQAQAPVDPIDPAAPLSGGVCLGKNVPADCNVVGSLPEVMQVLYVACAEATINASNSGDFSTQPGVCRKAGVGIARYRESVQAVIEAPAERGFRIAAATMFDFAGGGYEIAAGKLSADHCAMVEATYEHVVGGEPRTPVLPTRVKLVDHAVTQCRALFTCTAAREDGMTCTARAAPAAIEP